MKRSEIRDHLLDTAIALFNKRGFHAAGIDLIIAEAKVAKTTLYRHFPTKEALILAALKRRDEFGRGEMRKFVETRASDPRERLLVTFDYLEAWFATDSFKGCPFISAAGEHGEADDPVFQAAVHHKRKVLAYFRELAVAAGYGDADDIAREINLLHEGAVAVAQIARETSSAQFAKKMARRLLAT
ncbi:TetR family transcriptional regulator [Dongia mobilis]|uniref:TetR family transcriptional regulator n=1 Tax=Dongia mobilis TaxID=578943 RepID=A0A4R6WYD3_9PROT|nr:TetR family transcriptional regulator [Dongia mobilis]TDQ84453.1 TetR family transcriptional regulator [Dongia mobilis]